MSEPREIAGSIEKVDSGIYHWQIRNSAIGGAISSSHALATDGEGCVFIDPVRLSDEALERLPAPQAILLTARCHQRAAWRYRKQFGIEVWLPEDATEADEEPDRRYSEGDILPGDLRAIRTPGPEWPHYSFLLEAAPGVLFCSDLISHRPAEGLSFIPFEYHEDPAQTRRSVEHLLELQFSILCFDHGSPLAEDPKAALRDLLARVPA